MPKNQIVSPTKKQIHEDIERVAQKLERAPLWAEYFGKHGRCSERQVRKVAGGFQNVLNELGYVKERDPAWLVRTAKMESENAQLKAELRDAEKNLVSGELIRELVGDLNGMTLSEGAEWLRGARKQKSTHGTPTLMISDVHFDETVDPSQIQGINEYNREIASKRIEHTFKTSVMLLKDCFSQPKFDGIVCGLNGDMLSGIIHEELRETNAAPIAQSLFVLADLLKNGIGLLADEFGKVYVPCTIGNHGRFDKKPRAKAKASDNFEFILYNILAREFKSDPRVTFQVPTGPSLLYQVYGTRYLQEHGDAYKGGSGISGAMAPLFLGVHRKQKKQAAINQPFDYMVLGHWHTYFHAADLIINGSIKGYDEWVSSMNFRPEPPQQALWITHPEHGITFRAPVLCASHEQRKFGFHKKPVDVGSPGLRSWQD